jgi:prepilin signal peptidase PulO-like enzyme (type II secretory pathway)
MTEESHVTEKEIKEESAKEEKVYLRNYSKVIFFYPLFIASFILYLIQVIIGIEEPGLGAIWITIFFANLFVIAFDTSSTKFFIILLVVIILIFIFAFVFHPGNIISQILSFEITITMSYQFYLVSTIILGLIFIIAWIATRFDYWKVERNEVIHKKGIFVSVDRYPTKSLRIKKEIADIFEFALLRVGRIQLFFGGQDVIHLNTIININKKAKQLDYLLSDIEVDVETP